MVSGALLMESGEAVAVQGMYIFSVCRSFSKNFTRTLDVSKAH